MTGAELDVLLVAGAAAGKVAQLWLWPYGKCRRCKGTGSNWGSNGRRFGRCRKCGGSKSRVRLGARTVHKTIHAARSTVGWRSRNGGSL